MIQFWSPCSTTLPRLFPHLCYVGPKELDQKEKFPIRKYRKIKINSKCSVEKTINLRQFCYFDSQTNASVEYEEKKN